MLKQKKNRTRLVPGETHIGVGVFAIILNDMNQVLLIQKHGKDYWERPGGKISYGEHAIKALKREILEETNINIKILGPATITETIESNKHFIVINYMTKYVSGKVKIREPEKHSNLQWFDLDKLPKLTSGSTKILREYKKSLKK